MRPRLLTLAWPLLAELLLGFGVGLAGLWLASRESDTASAAFALSNHLQGTFFLLFRIISMGVSVVVAQSVGAGNRIEADRAARASLGASTWLGLAAGLVVFFFATPLLGLLNAPKAVLPLALPYLHVLALALLLDAHNAVMASVVRAHMHTREVMLNILAMHALHLLLCFVLMPRMGLVGFAWAMVASRLVGLLIHLALWRWTLRLTHHVKDWFALRLATLKPALHIGLPGAAENIAYRLAMLVSVGVVAGMGASELATHSYTAQVMTLIVLYSVAIGFAGEILVGHMVGAGQFRAAHRLVKKSLVVALVGTFFIAVAVAASASFTLRLFTDDAHIIKTAGVLLWITVILEPGRTCNIVIINALRAAGDARFPVVVGAGSMLLVMAGGSWLLGVVFNLGLVGVWIAYAADEWVRGIIMALRWWRLGWVPAARAAHRRVRKQGE